MTLRMPPNGIRITYTYVALGRVWLETAQARGDRVELSKALEALEKAVAEEEQRGLTLFGRALLLASDAEPAERMLLQATRETAGRSARLLLPRAMPRSAAAHADVGAPGARRLPRARRRRSPTPAAAPRRASASRESVAADGGHPPPRSLARTRGRSRRQSLVQARRPAGSTADVAEAPLDSAREEIPRTRGADAMLRR